VGHRDCLRPRILFDETDRTGEPRNAETSGVDDYFEEVEPERFKLELGWKALGKKNYAEAFAYLLPFAEIGHHEAQVILAHYVSLSLHRFCDGDACEQFMNSATEAELRAFYEQNRQDMRVAAGWFESASDRGDFGATSALADLYLRGYDGECWEFRRKQALALYAKAVQQAGAHGTELARILGDPPGESLIRMVELEDALGERYFQEPRWRHFRGPSPDVRESGTII
jgi:TPR repeat protein